MVAASMTLGSQPVTASDHIDSPAAADAPAADIADFYAWPTEGGNIVAIVTFGGLMMPADAPIYDADTLYTIHFDFDDDALSDHQIHVRFGQNLLENWGVQFENVPGSEGTFHGAVGTDLTSGDATATAGVFDDPFFFDFEGFTNTLLNTADPDVADDLAFSGLSPENDPVDYFAGTNVMGIVVEFPASALPDEPTAFSTWVTTGQIE